ncbi:MAG: galactose-1-phosphate uridylyltransferase [Thermoplasmata archaeon]|nr:galactose-1-phosphate uridylyltransferase [Thermoplasmata archaeon]
MNELRFNRITGEWVIVASERAKRKHEASEAAKPKEPLPEWKADCPFCPGNEASTPEELFSYREEENNQWKLRVIPNKFPVVSENNDTARTEGFFRKRAASGFHHVIVETPFHNRDIPDMSEPEVFDVVRSYFECVKYLYKNPWIKSVILFRNHGKEAGTSLIHPHSQVVGLAFVPTHIMDLFNTARCYAHENGRCVYCDTIGAEQGAGERVIYENAHFVAFVPYAAKLQYEIQIMPREHRSHFIDIGEESLNALSLALHKVLRALKLALDDPAYNLVLHTAPSYLKNVDYYHWYLEITPRLTIPAGLEMGSGITVNISQPEENAKTLREKVS